MHKRQELFKF